ncbi:hypothetical protein [Guptibacillus hwajinpoensis]|uniref:hypothetical protein n=1 Tax=Guptibacillus hwajinpoensis TaxID=208199 RepID=UPI001CFE4D6F|nr:hypothetical protein [Pseudalkalibacillus hwajinpoensis]WLR58159.1 hypothetical protein LC071_12995 [Pseudalkalibacillus hwajinpoensis]
MKKVFLVLSLSMLLVVAACGSNTNSANESSGDREQMDTKSVLLDFQSEIVSVLKENNEDIAAYESAKFAVSDSETPEEEKPSTEELKELKGNAVEASKATVEGIESLKVPSELNDSKKEIESALDELMEAYEIRAEQAAIDDSSVQEKALEHFTMFEDQMGKVFEDADLIKPSFAKELE